MSVAKRKNMIKQEEVYKIGRLGKSHGVRGEVSFLFDDDVFDRVDADYLILDIDGIRIQNVSVKNLGIIPDAFRRLGVKVKGEGDDLYIPRQRHYEIQSFIDGTIMTLADAPWPGLTPDLLSVLIVVATQARGSVLFHQKMFESRLFFVDKLIDMGAQIILCDPH